MLGRSSPHVVSIVVVSAPIPTIIVMQYKGGWEYVLTLVCSCLFLNVYTRIGNYDACFSSLSCQNHGLSRVARSTGVIGNAQVFLKIMLGLLLSLSIDDYLVTLGADRYPT